MLEEKLYADKNVNSMYSGKVPKRNYILPKLISYESLGRRTLGGSGKKQEAKVATPNRYP